MIDTIEIKRTKGNNCLVTMGGRAWLLGEHWSEGTNPAQLVGDLWFHAATTTVERLPEKWSRNERAAARYQAGYPERSGVFDTPILWEMDEVDA